MAALADLEVSSAVAFAICLVCAAFVNSVEAALIGVSEARVRQALETKVLGASRLGYWLANAGRVLTTLHLLRLTFIVGAGIVGYRAAIEAGLATSPYLVVVAVAAITLVFSHLVPRTLAKAHAVSWAISNLRIVRVLVVACTPVVWPLGVLMRALGRLTGGPGTAFWTPEEISRLAAESETHALGKRGNELLRSMLEFSDTVIREIMVPRTEMVALEVNTAPAEVRRLIVEAGHSRIPVYDDTIDNVLGILHVKDLFTTALDGSNRPLELRGKLRAAFYVPEVMKISELLKEFQRRKTHMAIVVDEYGGTAGVVTLEDVIEEIVGEIHDEYDVDDKQFKVISDTKVVADGRVNIWDLEQALAVDFPDDADYETLAGFLVSRAGYLPRAGTVITWGPLRFTVKEANDKRIGMVEIVKAGPAAEVGRTG